MLLGKKSKTYNSKRTMKIKSLFKAVALLAPLGESVMAQQWTTNKLPPGLVAWWQAESNYLDTVGTNHGSPVGGTTFAPGRAGLGL